MGRMARRLVNGPGVIAKGDCRAEAPMAMAAAEAAMAMVAVEGAMALVPVEGARTARPLGRAPKQWR